MHIGMVILLMVRLILIEMKPQRIWGLYIFSKYIGPLLYYITAKSKLQLDFDSGTICAFGERPHWFQTGWKGETVTVIVGILNCGLLLLNTEYWIPNTDYCLLITDFCLLISDTEILNTVNYELIDLRGMFHCEPE